MSFSYILAFLFVIPCICLFFSPVPDGNVLLDGAQAAVEFVISVTGSICFWSAVMEEEPDWTATLTPARSLTPVILLSSARTSTAWPEE